MLYVVMDTVEQIDMIYESHKSQRLSMGNRKTEKQFRALIKEFGMVCHCYDAMTDQHWNWCSNDQNASGGGGKCSILQT